MAVHGPAGDDVAMMIFEGHDGRNGIELAAYGDEKLKDMLVAWLTAVLARRPATTPEDQKIAAFLGRSSWTSATMIVRALAQSRPA